MNTLSGQSLGDRVNAARYAISGQGLARVVCKATTEELIAPKKKHIDYLLQCTNEPNVSIPQLATLLIDRTSHSNWVVVFKGLVTIHHLMCFGNERFTQYLASSNCNFQLSNYLDKSGPKCYDMSIFIRRYAKYLNAKALSYRTVAFDFTKLKRNDSETTLRSMGTEKLVKIVPVVQQQIDALIEFDCTASDLTNGVINAAFFLLFKDLVRMFACYNEGVISLLEKYFEQQNKKLVRDTLDIYKKFLARMDGVGNFLKIAEQIGIERGEIPDLSRAPASLLEAMEQHCAHVEGKKITTTTSGSTSNGAENGQTSAIKAIEEEEKFLNQLKKSDQTGGGDDSEKHIQEKKANNPFLSLGSGPNAPSSTAASTAATAAATTSSTSSKPSSNMFDMFGADVGNNSATSKATSDDLFTLSNDQSGGDGGGGQLGANNPFADILSAMSTTTTATTGNANATTGNNFATSDGFAAAFGSASNSNIDSTTEGGKSPTQDKRSAPPPRPQPPPSQQIAGPSPSRPPPPKGGAASPEDSTEMDAARAQARPPSRPPAPAAAASAMPTDSVQQMQQFMLMQQQCMQMLQQQQQQQGNANVDGQMDPAAMMAAQMAQMQMMMAAMNVTPPTTVPVSTVNQPSVAAATAEPVVEPKSDVHPNEANSNKDVETTVAAAPDVSNESSIDLTREESSPQPPQACEDETETADN
ncbi:hypothetical protein BLOT_012374 [Blomia tropicalis]|nr:hypothetical protein BLOT_012374 [Blomia tropicalis]